MLDARWIEQGLAAQGIPVYEADLPYLQHLLYTINQAQAPRYIRIYSSTCINVWRLWLKAHLRFS
ncbi:hypothetical protein [Ammoniphilus sp. YIM 78166]|uniref:hypothetical protein n=1 Tax=Ammoniphilus sp. YIM 78166 TaxID=1644106 RepID=UPI00106F4D2D|nr:hypothetical protein [Ammoniphilus sp. YIM 78166]